MSRAVPMGTEHREAVYKAQTGRSDLTPAQRRRTRHKMNDAARPTARIGRLRRRFDRNDNWYIQRKSAQFVALVRYRVQAARFSPKPNSKTQRRKAPGRNGQR